MFYMLQLHFLMNQYSIAQFYSHIFVSDVLAHVKYIEVLSLNSDCHLCKKLFCH